MFVGEAMLVKSVAGLSAMLALGLALNGPQETKQSAKETWFPVPVAVVERFERPSGSWMEAHGHRLDIEEWPVDFEIAGNELVVTIDSFNGLYGDTLHLRLRKSTAGDLEARFRAISRSDVGPLVARAVDAHGLVRFGASEIEGAAALMDLRLSWVAEGYGMASTFGLEARIELPAAFRWPATRPRLTKSLGSNLRVALTTNEDGSLRSRGKVDGLDRRQGEWTVWGQGERVLCRQTFRDGVRHGDYIAYEPDGAVFEKGGYAQGLRAKKWRRSYTGSFDWEGSFESGRKAGEWTKKDAEGRLRTRGTYEAGHPTGLWTTWWPNGAKRSEGRLEEFRQVGEWREWNADGSLKRIYEPRRWPVNPLVL